MKLSRSLITKAGAAAVVLAAAGTASVAQARDHVYFSIGANVAPGDVVNATNTPYYYAPRYVAPAPVYYYQPAPVYYAPAPVVGYYGPEYFDPVVRVRYYWHPVHHRYYYWDHGHRVWHR